MFYIMFLFYIYRISQPQNEQQTIFGTFCLSGYHENR